MSTAVSNAVKPYDRIEPIGSNEMDKRDRTDFSGIHVKVFFGPWARIKTQWRLRGPPLTLSRCRPTEHSLTYFERIPSGHAKVLNKGWQSGRLLKGKLPTG